MLRNLLIAMVWAGAATPGDGRKAALGGTIAALAKPQIFDAHYGANPMGYTLFATLSLGD